MNLLIQTNNFINRQLHKFGGSSLANAKCYQRVAEIMSKNSNSGDIIVVSASGNTTDQLIHWLMVSQYNILSAYKIKKKLKRYQRKLINNLLKPVEAKKTSDALINDLNRLAIMLNGNITDAIYAEIIGYGEIWSARLMSAFLNQQDIESQWIDARDFLYAERTTQPLIDIKLSQLSLNKLLLKYPYKLLIITGFICRNKAGETVLLGRNGSDYSATQIGALIGVSKITIWSDVSGIYSADPRTVKNAYLLPLLGFDEANELARFSTPVLHSRTLQPLLTSNIKLSLRCSYFPNQGSTRIEQIKSLNTDTKIITSNNNVCLIEINIPFYQNFTLINKKIELIIKNSLVKPLAISIHQDRRILQLCYITEFANYALYILKQAKLPKYCLQLRKNLALVALIGSGVVNNRLYRNYFYQQLQQQPIEFFWQSENDISLVAVLKVKLSKKAIQKLHAYFYN